MHNFRIKFRGSDGFSQDQFVLCSHQQKEIAAAYNKACDKTGINFINTVAYSYDEPFINEDIIEILKNHKIDVSDLDDPDEDNDNLVEITSKQYIKLLLAFIKLGNSRIKFELIPENAIPDLRLDNRTSFGRGLFR